MVVQTMSLAACNQFPHHDEFADVDGSLLTEGFASSLKLPQSGPKADHNLQTSHQKDEKLSKYLNLL